MRVRRLLAAVCAAALTTGMLAVAPASAQQDGEQGAQRVAVVSDGLDNVRGIDVGPDGSIYVAEAGIGGDECVTEGEGEEQSTICFGLTGEITRIDPHSGEQTVVAGGLPSVAGEDGSFATGVHDVSVADDGRIFAVIGLGGTPEDRDEWGEDGAWLGHLIEVTDTGTASVADLAAWEAENDPDRDQPGSEGVDSNPYGVHAANGTVFVAEAGGNTLLQVNDAGEIALFALFPPQMVERPPFLPPGGPIPSQAVPTSITEDAEGRMYVGELTGFPFPVGESRLWGFADGEPGVVNRGYSSVTGLTARGADLFSVEMFHKGLLQGESEGGDFSGGLVRRRPGGTLQLLLTDVLAAAGDAATDADGVIYVTNVSVFPGEGMVVRFDPSLTRDPAIQGACAPDEVAWPAFEDIFGNVHDEAIACLSWWGLTSGVTDLEYDVDGPLSRGQAAAFVARLVRAMGGDLPEDPEDAFDDDDGTTHEDDINALAAAGLVNGYEDGEFKAGEDVSRAEFVALLVRAYEHVTGEPLPSGPDAFDDDDGSTHEPAINAAAAADWVAGVGDRQFEPSENITRAQSASAVARAVATYVQEGHASPPQ